MQYESHLPKVTIGNDIRFKPKERRPGITGTSIRNFFGFLDSRDAGLRAMLNVGDDVSADDLAKKVDAAVQSDPLFLQNYKVDKKGNAKLIDNHAVGQAGIWLATDRKGTESAVIEKSAITERLKAMKDPVLRAIIANAGLPVPSTASHEELVALAEQASDPNRPTLDESGGGKTARVEGPATRGGTVSQERGEAKQ